MNQGHVSFTQRPPKFFFRTYSSEYEIFQSHKTSNGYNILFDGCNLSKKKANFNPRLAYTFGINKTFINIFINTSSN